MSELIPFVPHTLDAPVERAVSALALYEFLGLHMANYRRWAVKNIEKNPYAMEHSDWEGFHLNDENRSAPGSGGRPTQDYAVSLDFAKRLSMMARSAKGEEARRYFLECERIAHEMVMPHIYDHRTEIAIKTLLRLDAAEHRLSLMEEESHKQALALERAQALADAAYKESQDWLTIAMYVRQERLEHQLPRKLYAQLAVYLTAVCHQRGIEFHKGRGGAFPRNVRNKYPAHVLRDCVRPWLLRRESHTDLRIVPDSEEN